MHYRDEDHDLCFALQKFNTPPEKLVKPGMSLPQGWPRNWNESTTTSPFSWGHLGFFVDDLVSVLQAMRDEKLGKVERTTGPADAPDHAFIYDPEGNAVELGEYRPGG
jgi:catechol 2,3-dioxygenase-like lactoylglutathione lyase family enzyme